MKQLKKAREIYFMYFSSQRMACTKAMVCKCTMRVCPLYHPPGGKAAVWKSGKGKTPQIGVKRLDKMRPKAIVKPTKGRRFRLGMKTLCKICWYQKMMELLIYTQTAILMTGLRNIAKGAWISSNPGWSSFGFTWGSQGICHLLNGGYKPVCNPCKASNNTTPGHAASPKDKGEPLNNFTS